MAAHHHVIATFSISLLLLAAAAAQSQLVAFRDLKQGKCGYRSADGRVAIAPRSIGAGVFRGGRAPVKDADGFAIFDESGRIVELAERSSPAHIRTIPVNVLCRRSVERY